MHVVLADPNFVGTYWNVSFSSVDTVDTAKSVTANLKDIPLLSN